MKLAIDPGSKAVGVSLWINGNPLPLKTIYPKGRSFEERRENLRQQLSDYLIERQTEWDDQITALAVEEFQLKYVRKRNKSAGYDDLTTSIRKLEFITGYTLGFLQEMLDLELDDIFLVNKKFKPKSEAQLIASKYNLEGSKDAMDALHIAVLAGFDE